MGQSLNTNKTSVVPESGTHVTTAASGLVFSLAALGRFDHARLTCCLSGDNGDLVCEEGRDLVCEEGRGLKPRLKSQHHV